MNQKKAGNKDFLKKYRGFIAGVAVLLSTGFFIQGKGTGDDASYFEISKNLDIFANLFKELNTYYVDPIEPGKLIRAGIDAMLDGLDPYTNYISESDIEEYEFMTTGRYGGVGATMRHRENNIYIGDVYENSPAQKAGLHPGELVISIDNQSTTGKNLDEIGLLLKGSPGTTVTIRVRDIFTNTETDKSVERGEIELSSVPYTALVGTGKNIAYVTLTQFTPNCARQVRNSLDSLKKVQPQLTGIVLDLRNNPGGLVDEAVNLCNIFLDRGQLVVSTKGKNADWDKEYKTQGPAWDTKIPLTVIVNHSSASASEIVAGTLQDLDRAVIIGERSYGKGLVQTTRALGYNSRLKLTTAKYYTPSGRCIQALDYTHRNPDGSVGHIPDSLKKSYKTANGRTVLSGGGVEPDVSIENEPVSRIVQALYSKSYLFDYATQYVKTHKSIPPADQFSLSDAEFHEFEQWLEGKDYSYETETEIQLDSLQAKATREKYYDGAIAEFAALRSKISHDKKSDLEKNKKEVRLVLENEIASRFYFLRGRIAHSLRSDKEFDKAISLINDPTAYNTLLSRK